MTLVTGGIATNFFVNMQTLIFPENSYYKPIKEIIEEVPEENPYGVNPNAFAQDIVRRVERGANGKQWVGGGAGVARFGSWLLPQGVIVSIPLKHNEQLNLAVVLTVSEITGCTRAKYEAICQEAGARACQNCLSYSAAVIFRVPGFVCF